MEKEKRPSYFMLGLQDLFVTGVTNIAKYGSLILGAFGVAEKNPEAIVAGGIGYLVSRIFERGYHSAIDEQKTEKKIEAMIEKPHFKDLSETIKYEKNILKAKNYKTC